MSLVSAHKTNPGLQSFKSHGLAIPASGQGIAGLKRKRQAIFVVGYRRRQGSPYWRRSIIILPLYTAYGIRSWMNINISTSTRVSVQTQIY